MFLVLKANPLYFRRMTAIFNRSYLKTVLLAGGLLLKAGGLVAQASPSPDYSIKATFHPYTKGFVYLAHYFGKTIYLKDSALLNGKGEATFKGKEKLQGGIYMLVNPGKNQLVEMLIDQEQHFSVVADSSDVIRKTKFTGSKENELFNAYQVFAASQFQRVKPLQESLKSVKTHADSVKINEQLQQINKETMAYRQNVLKQYPNRFISALFRLMQEPVIPDAPLLANGKKDSLFAFRYYKLHYWDGVLFSDERLLFTPMFEPRLDNYFARLVSPEPDSVKEEVNHFILYSRSNKTMFKYFVSKFTNDYANPKYMGQDAVFLDLFDKYYQTNQVDWLTDVQRQQINNRAYSLMANQLGEPAADLQLLDTTDHSKSLYTVKAPLTVVVFWDPDCGHCQQEVPKLDSLFESKWKKQGIQIYAVLVDTVKTDVAKITPVKANWMKYIREHHLEDWINVYETPQMKAEDVAAKRANYRQLFDVYQTPTLYLLDEQKRIVGKKLSYDQVDELIQRKMSKSVTQNTVSGK